MFMFPFSFIFKSTILEMIAVTGGPCWSENVDFFTPRLELTYQGTSSSKQKTSFRSVGAQHGRHVIKLKRLNIEQNLTLA